MPSNYNLSPEQKPYRDPVAAGNLLTRLDHVNFGPEYLQSILDPTILKEAVEYFAKLGSQNEAATNNASQEATESGSGHEVRAETVDIGVAAMNVVQKDDNLLSENLNLASQEAYVAGLAGDNVEAGVASDIGDPLTAEQLREPQQSDYGLAGTE